MGVYEFKQYLIVRKDLKMPAGKLAAQAAHASLGALLKSSKVWVEGNEIKGYKIDYNNPILKGWLEGSFAKVCLEVNSKEELDKYFEIAQKNHIPCAYIIDNGTTVFNGVATPTCIGVGPARSEDIEPLFKELKLYK